MLKRVAGTSAFAFALWATGAAAATTHVFDLSKHGPAPIGSPTANAFTLASGVPTTEGGVLTGTFTGASVSGLSIGSDGTILGGTFEGADEADRFNNGIGVCRDGNCLTRFQAGTVREPHTVDGVADGIFDYVQMAFAIDGAPVDVTLTSLTFGWIGEWRVSNTPLGYDGSNGAFDIILDALGDEEIGIDDAIVVSDVVVPTDVRNSRGTVSFAGSDVDLVDSVFGVKAGENGSWKLLTATVSYERIFVPPAPPPSPIPLPAAGWLLIGGLGGLAWVGRRKR